MTRRLLIVGVVLLLVGGVAAAVHQVRKCRKNCRIAKHERIEAKAARTCAPAERKIDLAVEGKSLADVMIFLASQGLNFVYSDALADLQSVKVTANLKQVTVEAAACAVLKSVNWRYELTPEKILVVFGR